MINKFNLKCIRSVDLDFHLDHQLIGCYVRVTIEGNIFIKTIDGRNFTIKNVNYFDLKSTISIPFKMTKEEFEEVKKIVDSFNVYDDIFEKFVKIGSYINLKLL